MAELWIGIISLIVSSLGLIMTIFTFHESRTTKHAVLSHKTRKEYDSYKTVIIPKLQEIRDGIVAGNKKPEYRTTLIETATLMTGYEEHQNVATKAALKELALILGANKETDKNADPNIAIMKSILQMTQVPIKSKVIDQSLTDALSKLIGALRQPDPQLFD